MTNLKAQLHSYNPSSIEEQEFKARMLAFMQDYDNCFERSLQIGHFTASSWLLNKDHSKALMMHHAKLDQWLQLGGHCDGNPDTLAVAIKEAQEESGIQGIEAVLPQIYDPQIYDIDIHWIPDNAKERGHYHYDVRYLLHLVSDEEICQNSESKELRWIGKDPAELPTTNPSIIRMFNKWLSL